MDYVLKPLKDLKGQEILISSDPTGEMIAIDPDRNVKYVFVIDVGSLPPRDAGEHLKSVMDKLVKFLGKDRVMIMPRRSDQSPVHIYQIEPVVE